MDGDEFGLFFFFGEEVVGVGGSFVSFFSFFTLFNIKKLFS